MWCWLCLYLFVLIGYGFFVGVVLCNNVWVNVIDSGGIDV